VVAGQLFDRDVFLPDAHEVVSTTRFRKL